MALIEDEVVEEKISKEIKPAVERFRELTKSCSVDETFLFFTDPHLLKSYDQFGNTVKKNLVSSFSTSKEVYDLLSLKFCLCGGDWLNSGDSQSVAMEKLLYADSIMKSIFSRYYKIMGNHDTNYQGIVSPEDSSRGDLSRAFIDKVYFSETGSAYYSFKGNKTLFYVLDSGLDSRPKMDEYRWEQLLWLADQLLSYDYEHQIICLHMFYRLGKLVPMSEFLIQLCEAYNSKCSISLNGVEYDYSSTYGTIHVILSGHNHLDEIAYVGENGDIPVIQTCNFCNNGSFSFDICLLDYRNHSLDLIRVGNGDNRQVQLRMSTSTKN